MGRFRKPLYPKGYQRFKSSPHRNSNKVFNMTFLEPIFLIFSAVAVVFLILDVFVIIWLLKINRKFKVLFEGKNAKDLENILMTQLQRTMKLETKVFNLSSMVEKLQGISEKTFQKMGAVRFNPFNDIGGNQSFAVALLDNEDNGFIISSLFIKEGNRVYAKAIKKGECEFPLSKEEKEALDKAINSNGIKN